MTLRMFVPMVFVVAGLTLGTPADGMGQEANLRAQATILAPVEVPTVRAGAELVEGEWRPVVTVTSEDVWSVLMGPEGEERVVAGRLGAGQRWESSAAPASRGEAGEAREIRVVLSAL